MDKQDWTQKDFGLGAELICIERERQMDTENFDASHDDDHAPGEMESAAAAYLMAAAMQAVYPDDGLPPETPPMWPKEWSANIWWKPSKDPIRNLVKAGALIAAAIDRHQRARNTSQHRGN